MLDTTIVWQTQLGYFSTESMGFVENPGEFTPLYSDTGDPENLVLADKAFLRQTLVFYGYPVAEALKNRLDKIQDIQAEYAPLLTGLQEAKTGAEMRDDADDVAEIKAEYMALLQEMNGKIQAVPHD